MLVIGAAASMTFMTARADSTSPSLGCVDRNGNGVIDIPELFDVIDAYFDGTSITAPTPEPPTSTPPATSTPTPTYTATPSPTPPPNDGTRRSKAWPYGQKFQAGHFDMQITGVDLDAWPEIQEENQFNDPPDEGYRFVMWTMDIQNIRGSADEYERISASSFDLIGSYNVEYRTTREENRCGVIPDRLSENLYRGGQTTGNVCFAVPIDETGLTFLYDTYHDDANGDAFSVEVWFEALPSGN